MCASDRLVTGGTGFIGRYLVKALLARNDKVTVLTRNVKKAEVKLGTLVNCIDTLEHLKSPPDAIVNLAGAPIAGKKWTVKYKAYLKESRLKITQEIVRYARQVTPSPKVFISGSAIGFYGIQGDMPLSEDSRPHTCFTHEMCKNWEQEALEAQKAGIRVCLLRTGIVLGHGGMLKKILPAFRLGLGGPMGDGKQWFSWVHIADLVSMILFLIDHDTCQGPFNATAPHPVTNEVFSKMLASILHRPAFFREPKVILRALFGQMADELLLQGQRVVPTKFQEAGFSFQHPELKGALENILR